jgi:hypothetical protein
MVASFQSQSPLLVSNIMLQKGEAWRHRYGQRKSAMAKVARVPVPR